MDALLQQIASLLKDSPDRDAAFDQALALVLTRFNSETGTIHLLDREKQLLHINAHIGVPPPVVEHVRVIPVGKGIAGQTVVRNAPVTMCNLQTDTSGVAKPNAKKTGVGGALCVPLRNGSDIVGTIGIGTVREYEYSPEETQLLDEIGRVLGTRVTA